MEIFRSAVRPFARCVGGGAPGGSARHDVDQTNEEGRRINALGALLRDGLDRELERGKGQNGRNPLDEKNKRNDALLKKFQSNPNDVEVNLSLLSCFRECSEGGYLMSKPGCCYLTGRKYFAEYLCFTITLVVQDIQNRRGNEEGRRRVALLFRCLGRFVSKDLFGGSQVGIEQEWRKFLSSTISSNLVCLLNVFPYKELLALPEEPRRAPCGAPNALQSADILYGLGWIRRANFLKDFNDWIELSRAVVFFIDLFSKEGGSEVNAEVISRSLFGFSELTRSGSLHDQMKVHFFFLAEAVRVLVTQFEGKRENLNEPSLGCITDVLGSVVHIARRDYLSRLNDEQKEEVRRIICSWIFLGCNSKNELILRKFIGIFSDLPWVLRDGSPRSGASAHLGDGDLCLGTFSEEEKKSILKSITVLIQPREGLFGENGKNHALNILCALSWVEGVVENIGDREKKTLKDGVVSLVLFLKSKELSVQQMEVVLRYISRLLALRSLSGRLPPCKAGERQRLWNAASDLDNKLAANNQHSDLTRNLVGEIRETTQANDSSWDERGRRLYTVEAPLRGKSDRKNGRGPSDKEGSRNIRSSCCMTLDRVVDRHLALLSHFSECSEKDCSMSASEQDHFPNKEAFVERLCSTITLVAQCIQDRENSGYNLELQGKKGEKDRQRVLLLFRCLGEFVRKGGGEGIDRGCLASTISHHLIDLFGFHLGQLSMLESIDVLRNLAWINRGGFLRESKGWASLVGVVASLINLSDCQDYQDCQGLNAVNGEALSYALCGFSELCHSDGFCTQMRPRALHFAKAIHFLSVEFERKRENASSECLRFDCIMDVLRSVVYVARRGCLIDLDEHQKGEVRNLICQWFFSCCNCKKDSLLQELHGVLPDLQQLLYNCSFQNTGACSGNQEPRLGVFSESEKLFVLQGIVSLIYPERTTFNRGRALYILLLVSDLDKDLGNNFDKKNLERGVFNLILSLWHEDLDVQSMKIVLNCVRWLLTSVSTLCNPLSDEMESQYLKLKEIASDLDNKIKASNQHS